MGDRHREALQEKSPRKRKPRTPADPAPSARKDTTRRKATEAASASARPPATEAPYRPVVEADDWQTVLGTALAPTSPLRRVLESPDFVGLSITPGIGVPYLFTVRWIDQWGDGRYVHGQADSYPQALARANEAIARGKANRDKFLRAQGH